MNRLCRSVSLLCWASFSTLLSAQAPAPLSPTAPSLAPRTETTLPLPESVMSHLSSLPLLFDGATLNGWIQAPPAPLTVSRDDIKDLAALVKRLRDPGDRMGAYLLERFDEAGRQALGNYAPDHADQKPTASALARSLTAVLAGAPIFEASRFEGVRLRPETRALLDQSTPGESNPRLNRMLVEDALPGIITQSPLTAWVVKDGAMASTGAGRGVIYTQKDYTRYRLVFEVRQLSGNHVPGILIFCHRPTPGEKHDSALNGIQFQVPNGGHWDYRAGVNKAGAHFRRPTRTKFNLQQWAQVEVLVNAVTGTARMAVAQPVGTRGIVNLEFTDPAAGRPGPIAWQMHNAGLFDEFRNVRIEIDPAEDRLITTE